MAEYIEYEKTIEHLSNDIVCLTKDAEDCRQALLHEISRLPKSDVAPVEHGKWCNCYGDFTTAECSLCGELYEVSPEEQAKSELFDLFKRGYRYCPNCGARMDGGGNG